MFLVTDSNENSTVVVAFLDTLLGKCLWHLCGFGLWPMSERSAVVVTPNEEQSCL